MPAYHPKVVEPRWQRHWEENRTFHTPDLSDLPKYYILDMFPYPSGAGLHVGHPEGYTATDILARYKRMRGFHVLHPMGWDAFGLPAEQYAIQTGTHPRVTTQKNIDNFRRQIKMLGFSYDWEREVDTTDPDYFRWTQWIFLVLFDTWYDPAAQKGRPIAELPIPDDVKSQGDAAIRTYRDSKRLAYQAEVPVNWCPALGTVLANEEVIDGKSERGNHPVVRMPLRQWLLRITDYAERLIDDLAPVDWPEPIKKMQRDWIGRSEGAEVDFALQKPPTGGPAKLRVFTTRPDTLFGATYMVLSPEHPLVDLITTPDKLAGVREYQQQAARKSEMERTDAKKKKTGVDTGAFAVNPVNGELIPIWIADYVLSTYGTGAIMAVPAHDERDFEFAQQYRLPIRPVVMPPKAWLEKTKIHQTLAKLNGEAFLTYTTKERSPDTLTNSEMTVLSKTMPIWEQSGQNLMRVTEHLYRFHVEMFSDCFSDEGIAINSGTFNGRPTAEFKQQISAWLEMDRKGQRRVNYKLRDWLFSRQRYWGEPFPILHEVDAQGNRTGVIEPLRPDELPLRLPDLEDFKPTGNPEPPLGKAKEWLAVERDGKRYTRETNTMPQWAGSCWYYLRYLDPKNSQTFCDPAKLKHWLPVDLYVGGAEHAVLHLLYSRFWHKVLFDRGHVPCPEPFHRLVNQGMILGEIEYNGFQVDGQWISAEKVDFDGDVAVLKRTETKAALVKLKEDMVEKKGEHFHHKEVANLRVDARAAKMSKSRGNVINPDTVVDEYGADALRLYEMFMGPLEATKPWSMRGVEGVFRFLNRVWRLAIDDRAEAVKLLDSVQDVEPDKETLRALHHAIKKVGDDLESMSFNTAIAAMMELTNHLTGQTVRPRSVLKTFMLLLAPFAPHLAEEIWHALGGTKSLSYETWPTYDAALLQAESVEIPVQVNGKMKAKLTVPAGLDAKGLEEMAKSDEKVRAALEGKTIKKVIVVPGKLVNLVV
jgi:leucyl-tRNA synthetase